MTDLQETEKRADAILKREQKRWFLRRWVVIISFATMIVLVLFMVIVTPLLMTSEQAKVISENNDLIKFILGLLTSIILTFFGLASVDDVKSKAMGVVKDLFK